jgi:hypothetical protein
MLLNFFIGIKANSRISGVYTILAEASIIVRKISKIDIGSKANNVNNHLKIGVILIASQMHKIQVNKVKSLAP